MYERNVLDEIRSFLQTVIEAEKPDLIVCAERKATAIMRCLLDESDPPLPWDWKRVLSTSAIHQFDWSRLEVKRVLVFDELVHHGRALDEHVTKLRALVPADTLVRSAAFAVWERCEHRPDIAFHGAVDQDTYELLRDKIVSMLQEHGSLLLDTEHLELSVMVQCGMRDFYDALARAAPDGNTWSFVSGASRTNLTIERPDIVSDQLFQQCLLPESNPNDSVSKVRVLERTHEQFALLPICYPNTRCLFAESWADKLPDFIDAARMRDAGADELFYTVGLLTSVELLRGTVSALGELAQQGKVVVQVPPQTLEHLRVMFPRLDIDKLSKHLLDVVASSERERPRRGAQSVRARNVPEEALFRLAGLVMYRVVGDPATSLKDFDDLGYSKSWRQLMRLASEENANVGLDPRALSVVADRLIDNGMIVTKTRRVLSSARQVYTIRTFAPDGEIVMSRIRRQIMTRRPECLLAT